MSRNWTTEQLAAIETTGCNILVSAAAGSGKTAVLVERIIRLLCHKENPVDIDRLLVVTFTEAAATEMKERIAAALEREIKVSQRLELKRQLSLLNGASISTLHAFCLEVIQRYFYLLEIDPTFRVADELEANMLRQDVMAHVLEKAFAQEEESFLQLAEYYGGKNSDEGLIQLVLKLYQFAWSNPAPFSWLSEVAAYYALEEGKSMEAQLQRWLQPIKNELRMILEQAADALVEAQRLCRLPGGPLVYEETLKAELAQVNRLQNLLAEPWQKLREGWLGAAFERLRPAKGTDEELKEKVQALRQRAKNLLTKALDIYFVRTLDEYVAEIKALAPLLRALVKLTKNFAKAYEEAKRRAGLLDFNDLEHYCLKILRKEGSEQEPSAAARELRTRFEYVLVDEYQDINPVQEAILQLVSRQGAKNGNLFMVGDVKQSIYRFRLGDPSIFLKKYNSYGLTDENNKKILLSRNFRCRNNIVAAVNYLFTQLMSTPAMEIEYNQEAALVYGADYPPPAANEKMLSEEVEVVLLEKNGQEMNTDSLEAEESFAQEEELASIEREGIIIAEKILQLMDPKRKIHVFDKDEKCYRPISFRDIVILLRSTVERANYLVEILSRYNIPASAELSTGYFAATEVETMLSLLKILDNPRQDIPLAAVLRAPFVGFTPEDLATIRKIGGNNVDFWQALQITAASEIPGLSEALRAFLGKLDSWRTLARREKLAALIASLYRETGYVDYVAGLPDGMRRQANLRALFSRARQFDRFSRQGLSRFLLFIEQLRSAGEDLGTARSLGENENVVRIMSIHKSKGLEFPVVFICDLGKNFNFRDLRAEILMHSHYGIAPLVVCPEKKIRYPSLPYLALRLVGEAETRAEEMRILYVALTRAREKLYLIGSVNNLSKVLNEWQETKDLEKIPPYYICKATNYLEWLGRALARHPDISGDNNNHLEAKGSFSLTCLEKALAKTINSEEKEEERQSFKKAILTLNPLPVEVDPEVAQKVKENLAFDYPSELSFIPAKLSVTEIKRRFAQEDFSGDETSIYADFSWSKPAFTEKRLITPQERGLIYHTVLQYLDLNFPCDEQGIKKQIKEMAGRGILSAAEMNVLEPDKISSFFKSAVGQLVLEQKDRVLREWPFTLAIPAAEIAAVPQDCDDHVIIQGIIDLLIPKADGYILVDYKTDRLPKGGPEELKKRYYLQLKYYGKAVETILKKPVKAAYLYVLEAASFIQVY
ncbi:MAG: helicase-exonuclease AddAB subunit AddA [Firmicutes bacterium]|nr:helicase-exonuclease AddAB subunit AddA [Bacillota bacterium]